jgi:hypothetical protein
LSSSKSFRRRSSSFGATGRRNRPGRLTHGASQEHFVRIHVEETTEYFERVALDVVRVLRWRKSDNSEI